MFGPENVLEAVRTGISNTLIFISTVPCAPLSTISTPKLELRDLSLSKEAVVLIRT